MDAALAQGALRIGMVAGFSGPVASVVQESAEGARLYFDAVNAQGGIKGQNIELVTQDDKYDPATAAAAAKSLASQGVLALMLSRGTGPTESMLPVLKDNRLPLIAPATGAISLYEPIQPYVFHLRASYQREAERAVRHLAGIGVKRITIVQVNDPFGNDAGKGAIKGLDEMKLRAMSHLRFDRNRPDLAPTMQAIAKANIEAVVFIGPAYAVVEGVNALRAAGSTAHVATLSNNASADFVKALGENARGIIVTQLFPYERSTSNPLVREALALAKAAGRHELTPAQLEGFAAARLVVEAIKRAGKDLSREGLLKALDGARIDLGGLQVHYTEKDHTGLEFTDVSIVGPDGKFWR
ncbi:ABC transporter substrate-binding protein [Pelomonas sp. P7]|uniref:ABC transporter substrate-binding protein n=1 Tax=Pelomonas caseinilytica TaxID=2906763 RepID=A0ABS8XHD7_9BURK|nr:ABC transporter substrate-binding protein [Pelomonas sp. P7]MCE4540266.1 ABC transporter substrate-binding protein [Pelomonas sp. P7]